MTHESFEIAPAPGGGYMLLRVYCEATHHPAWGPACAHEVIAGFDSAEAAAKARDAHEQRRK